MVELTQILKKEQEQKQAVETTKKQTQAELEKKKQALAEELETTGITKQQEGKVLEYKDQQTRQIRKTAEEDFETQLALLKRKEQTNSVKAIEFVVNSLSIE
ncbi:MAG: hypothetical protein HQ539_01310 [Parcubacteria group bacterium]|nr:hypothetical protein [Parcubacteria group bacterium]